MLFVKRISKFAEHFPHLVTIILHDSQTGEQSFAKQGIQTAKTMIQTRSGLMICLIYKKIRQIQ